MSYRKSFYGFCSTVALCLLLTGCKGLKQVVEVPVYIHDTTQTVREVHDSTYIDRWHTVEVKGDTVYWHDSIVYIKYCVKTDTAYKYVEKPVVVSKTETVEVKKSLSWWQKTFIGIGIVALVALIGIVIWKTKKWWIKWI